MKMRVRTAMMFLGAMLTASAAFAGGRFGTITLNSHQVNPLPNGAYEVLEEPWDGPREFWCVAALHAMHRLGAKNSTRVYLVRPYGASASDPRRRSVGYTITPSAEVKQKGESSNSINVSIKQVGRSLSVGHARQFCFRDPFF